LPSRYLHLYTLRKPTSSSNFPIEVSLYIQ
jgi:hypothetical protein